MQVVFVVVLLGCGSSRTPRTLRQPTLVIIPGAWLEVNPVGWVVSPHGAPSSIQADSENETNLMMDNGDVATDWTGSTARNTASPWRRLASDWQRRLLVAAPPSHLRPVGRPSSTHRQSA
eukprot:2374402-Rhodomonas_salina.6